MSTITRIFDPLGLLAPFVITLKMLLQKLWRSGIIWDHAAPLGYIPIIEKTTRHCGKDYNAKLPSFIGQIGRHSDKQLLVFTDDFQCAMAACIYFCISSQTHKQSSFRIRRTKVAPLN